LVFGFTFGGDLGSLLTKGHFCAVLFCCNGLYGGQGYATQSLRGQVPRKQGLKPVDEGAQNDNRRIKTCMKNWMKL
jgi:hypothetical protein